MLILFFGFCFETSANAALMMAPDRYCDNIINDNDLGLFPYGMVMI